jgi:uncharacterized protein (DUF433 family)
MTQEDRFLTWCEQRISSDLSVLGGEPVFAGTRLSVRRIAEAAERGETVARLLEDYPYLTEEDVAFARKFAIARPRSIVTPL